MREVINISLPSPMVKTIKKAVKDGNYISTSEFFRDLFRVWQATQLVNELEASRDEIRTGKGKKLKSLRDLR